jgi:hypothetical protein
MPQTTTQILRCLVLGKYTAAVVEDGHLDVQGPQPLAGLLPDSIKANRDELVEFLAEYGGGAWPPATGSKLRTESLDCGLAVALELVERARRGAAA